MVDNIPVVPNKYTKEELLEQQYKKKTKELQIARTRAGVVRNQLLDAYKGLEDIRLDYLGDSAFREKIVRAKQGIELAIDDYLLADSYYEERIKKHRKLSPEEYDKELRAPVAQQGKSKK